MVKTFTKDILSSKYRDDFDEDKGYQRILFNNNRALQARELTQLQTVIQESIGRFGRNIFKEGAAISEGGLSINRRFRYIKLNTSVYNLPSIPENLHDTSFIGQTSGVTVKIIQALPAKGSDPATIYVQYTNTVAATSSQTTITVTPGEELVQVEGSQRLIVQSINTTLDPAFGYGTKISAGEADFFTSGFFIHTPMQELILSKYSDSVDKVVGFLVTQDIITSDDDQTLFDNQGQMPNFTAPGADRYRISLTLTTQDAITQGQTFCYFAQIIESQIADKVSGLDNYNLVNDLMATRTNDESGDYTVQPFFIRFEDSA